MYKSLSADLFANPLREIGLIALFGSMLWWIRKSLGTGSKSLPPGPTGLPWIGYTPCLGSSAFEELQKLKDTYGDIVCLTLLGNTVIVLNSYEAVHEAAIANRTKVGRHTLTTNHWLARGYGISNYDTPRALELRHALYRHLYGYEEVIGYLAHDDTMTGAAADTVENKLVQTIRLEIQQLIDKLKEQAGKPTEVLALVRFTVWRVMWQVVFGTPCLMMSREQIEQLLNQISTNNTENSMLQVIQLLPKKWLPFIDRIPLVTRILGMDKLYQRYTAVCTALNKELERYCAMDKLFPNALLYRLKEDSRLAIQMPELQRLLFELMAAGTDTSSLTLTAACGYLAERTTPLCDDDESMSVHLDRIHRKASVVPLALPHTVRQPIHLAGYCLPPGSILLFNLYAVHEAQSRSKCPSAVASIPFSLGSRACPGNRFASKLIEDIIRAVDRHFVVKTCTSDASDDICTRQDTSNSRGLTRLPSKLTFIFDPR